MGSDDDVGLARFEIGENCFLFPRCLKSTEGIHLEGKISEPLAERSRMLIGENRRRHEDDYLPA